MIAGRWVILVEVRPVKKESYSSLKQSKKENKKKPIRTRKVKEKETEESDTDTESSYRVRDVVI